MCKILCSTRICHFFSKKSRQSHSFLEIDHDVGCNYCRWKDATGFRRKRGQNQCGGLPTAHSEGRLKSNRIWALQQGCAPAHSTKSTISLCNKIFSGFLGQRSLASIFPNLNPMDYLVWSILERKACATSRASLKSLKSALEKAWDEIIIE